MDSPERLAEPDSSLVSSNRLRGLFVCRSSHIDGVAKGWVGCAGGYRASPKLSFDWSIQVNHHRTKDERAGFPKVSPNPPHALMNPMFISG